MLMDNSGVTGRIISSGGEQSANTANAASQFEQLRPEDVVGSFDAYVNSGAVLAPNIETPNVDLGPAPEAAMQFPNSAEQMMAVGEQMPNMEQNPAMQAGEMPNAGRVELTMPQQPEKVAEAKTASASEDMPADFEGVKATPVPRDSEKIPSAYMNHYVNGIDQCLKDNDPGKLVSYCDASRWDYMEKCFGRKMGDGLNGKVA